jgi:ubiquinone/menaquinone biosynthesis C-methylase UbiE
LWLLDERTAARNSVAGLDRSAAILAKARARFARTPLQKRVTFHDSAILDMPFGDGEFDLVWISHVLHGQPDIVGSLTRLRRAIRKRGAIAVREDRSSAFLLPYDIGLGEPGLEARLTAV